MQITIDKYNVIYQLRHIAAAVISRTYNMYSYHSTIQAADIMINKEQSPSCRQFKVLLNESTKKINLHCMLKRLQVSDSS